MLSQANNKGYVLFLVVANLEMGSKILKEARKLGIKGGTILMGKGTAKSHILDILGLNERRKEIVIMLSEAELEDKIHQGLTERFQMDKPNHGIIISSFVNKIIGTRTCAFSNEKENRGELNMGYEAIFTIVERGLGEDVVDAATAAGASGATIINARGSGIHEHSTLFAMDIEPEKEIVMIIIDKAKSDAVIKSIKEKMHIEEPGKGIMFTLDVSKTSGLLQ